MRNRIHPTAIIEGDVRMGSNNVVHPYTILIGPLEIGDDNIIGPHVVIGGPGQDTRNPRYDASGRLIRIGSHNIIREHSAVQKPCYEEITWIGDHTHVMHGAHIPHDAWIEDHVVITPGVVLAGCVRILEGANLSLGCTVHQRSVIGQFAMVAMGAPVTKNVPPFSMYIPGKKLSVNTYAVEKYGFGQHAEAIARCVMNGWEHPPAGLMGMVERYRKLHEASGRRQYAAVA